MLLKETFLLVFCHFFWCVTMKTTSISFKYQMDALEDKDKAGILRILCYGCHRDVFVGTFWTALPLFWTFQTTDQVVKKCSCNTTNRSWTGDCEGASLHPRYSTVFSRERVDLCYLSAVACDIITSVAARQQTTSQSKHWWSLEGLTSPRLFVLFSFLC